MDKYHIGNKISVLRKQNHFTQEQLANAVGVSVPAVSKWENGMSSPDIMLLSPLARVLKTDINNLLSFQENLTQQEVNEIMDKVRKLCRKKGYSTGMSFAFDRLKEYPNSDYLKLVVANAVGMYPVIGSGEFNQEEFEEWQKESTRLFEELSHKKNIEQEDIREAAAAGLSARYIQEGRLEEAEQLLKDRKCQLFDGKRILPTVYLKQGKLNKAAQEVQKNILLDIQNLMSGIRMLYMISIQEKEYEKARIYAESYYQIGTQIPISPCFPSELLTEYHLLQRDVDKSMNSFSDYVEEILFASKHQKSSIFFDAIAEAVFTWSNDFENDIRRSMYQAISENPLYQPLLEQEQGRNILEKLIGN